MPRLPQNIKRARFVGTLNNYTEDECTNLQESVRTHCIYGIIGKEVGSSGTRHLQCYFVFRERCDFADAKDRLNPRLHVEVARGSPRQNRVYCSKDGDYYEHGELPQGGSNNGPSTRDAIARAFTVHMDEGRDGLARFADEHPGSFYFSGYNLLRNYALLQTPPLRPEINVRWFYGPPGAGKSRRAHEELPNAFIKEPRTKWWSGYLNEKEVIIDDFGPQGIDINHLLRWFDRYKCYVESKGGMIALCAHTFIVTSNFHPESVFYVNGERHPQTDALLRRIVLEEFFNE